MLIQLFGLIAHKFTFVNEIVLNVRKCQKSVEKIWSVENVKSLQLLVF